MARNILMAQACLKTGKLRLWESFANATSKEKASVQRPTSCLEKVAERREGLPGVQWGGQLSGGGVGVGVSPFPCSPETGEGPV